MKLRDLLLVGAILVVAGVAVADAVRGNGSAAVPETTAAVTSVATVDGGPEPVRGNPGPPSFPRDRLPGALVFTDADDCRVREVLLPRGFERPLPSLHGTCELWGAPSGSTIAYGLGPADQGSDAVPFRLVDLDRPARSLGGFRALFGFIAWSLDGRRAAWCGESRRGVDLELGGTARRLPDCPNAYAPDGRVGFARGSDLRLGDRVVAHVDGQITAVHWAADGSLALGVDGDRLVRLGPGGRTVRLPAGLEGRLPRFSPDNCAAALEQDARVYVVDLGCYPSGRLPARMFGTDSAWSPDGRWLAVAERATIAFYPLAAGGPPVRWPAAASELAWLR